MNETRRRMHAMLDGAFALFGPRSSKKTTMESEGQSPQPEEYPAPVPRPAVIPRLGFLIFVSLLMVQYGILYLNQRNALVPTTISWFPWRACLYRHKKETKLRKLSPAKNEN